MLGNVVTFSGPKFGLLKVEVDDVGSRSKVLLKSGQLTGSSVTARNNVQ